MTRNGRKILASIAMMALAACSPTQSAFAPMGVEADRINVLFWIMTIGGTLIFIGVLVAIYFAIFGGAKARGFISQETFISVAGIAFPAVVLTVLLIYGFVVLGAGAQTSPSPDRLRVSIEGELWWWRVTYELPDGATVETANELHLPTGEPVELALTSTNVIHSFWAPRVAGKLDMIPGRTNILTVTATEEGISRGQCAEFCGGAHALMSFYLVTHSPEDFEAWLEAEASAAVDPSSAAAARGEDVFLEAGCGSCHAVRGTEAAGSIGPDLTHVGSRRSLAAATLPNDAQAFADWITDNQHIKPDNKMPEYDIFGGEELADLANYLDALE